MIDGFQMEMDAGRKKKVIVGVCTMEKKSTSKPMQQILQKMRDNYDDYLDFLIFPESTILTKPVQEWPLCDCLISFHAKDFPLNKAIAYAKLHPEIFVLNDLEGQYNLLDRTKVYKILELWGIEHPRYDVLKRDKDGICKGISLLHIRDIWKCWNELSVDDGVGRTRLCGDQRPYIQQAICGEANECRRSQRLHLLPFIVWWRMPTTLPKSTVLITVFRTFRTSRRICRSEIKAVSTRKKAKSEKTDLISMKSSCRQMGRMSR